MGDTKERIKRGRQGSMMEQQRLFSTVFNRTCDVTTSVSSSFFLLKIPYGISQNRGQMISFLKRKKGEEYRRGLGRMYWQQSLRQINMPATNIMNYGCSDSRLYKQQPCRQQNISEIPVLFFLPFFVYFSYQKQGSIRCYQGFQRIAKAKLYPPL